MKSLVLGGNGFIGTHLVDALLEKDHFVRIYDRSPNRFRATPQNAEYIEAELDESCSLLPEPVEHNTLSEYVRRSLPDRTRRDDVNVALWLSTSRKRMGHH